MPEYHNIKTSAVIKMLKTPVNGLSDDEAKKRLVKHGYNELPKEKSLSGLAVFFSQFNSALVYILLITGFLSVLIGIFFDAKAFIDAGVIFAAVIINVVIGFFQENKANRAIAKLKNLVEHKAVVVRGGREVKLDSKEIVPGDIIIIKSGNRIPADARLIECYDLQVNESALTGESVPSKKNTEIVFPGASLADRENMIYAGTMAVHGSGKAVAVATGVNTEIGKIAGMVEGSKEEKTPLQKRLNEFSKILGAMFSFICVFIFVIGLYQGRGWLEMLETGVAVGVASIPEGLTVSVTFILALGMQQILKKKALTRKLIAAETLGSTTVICTDKTGTLTEGKMSAVKAIIGDSEFELNTLGIRQSEKDIKALNLALRVGMMCNNASVENPEEDLKSRRYIGDPTEIALLSAAIQSGSSKEELIISEPLVAELPFDNEKKFMATLHKKGGGYVMYEKGAPEKLLPKSVKYYHQGVIKTLSLKAKENLAKNYENMTSRGLRVIGVAIRQFKKGEIDPRESDWKKWDSALVFIGIIAIKDPLRPEAAETIKLCRQAGIRPIMITGDHKLTAKAIGGELGMDVKAENIIEGEELDKTSDEKLFKLVNKIDIYSRVSPRHKLRIVKALQSRGEVVAMTGDGINDSPALKAADIGISLGTGTDIAKETSDIVLLDDNFSTIVAAVRQGRVIFKNIRKVITYLISDSFSEVVLILGSIIFNTPLALLPAQILWINIVNDGLPHFSLAFEKDDDDTMKEKPIKKNEPILNKEMKTIIFGVGLARDIMIFGFFYYLLKQSVDVKELQTIMFAALGVKSLVSIFSIRSLSVPVWKMNIYSNIYLLLAVAASFLFLLLGIYWPPLQIMLSTVPLSQDAWVFIFLLAFFNMALIESVKLYFGSSPNRVGELID
jgi:P-type Ca2+ transporter type 2C